ncbi:extensin-like [Iris pallida]|uniref:Extensin-like n=1 Tax=Iris pallida TaxID=29817 RepID=A0AAX6EEV1_IRIPA|nr:extensin-like [Iris pallida]
MAGPPPARPSNLSFLLLSRSPPSSPPHFLLSKPPPIHLQLQPATMASPPSATVCTAARHSRRPLPWTANVPPACGMTALARTGAPLARAHGRAPCARARAAQRRRGRPAPPWAAPSPSASIDVHSPDGHRPPGRAVEAICAF